MFACVPKSPAMKSYCNAPIISQLTPPKHVKPNAIHLINITSKISVLLKVIIMRIIWHNFIAICYQQDKKHFFSKICFVVNTRKQFFSKTVFLLPCIPLVGVGW